MQVISTIHGSRVFRDGVAAGRAGPREDPKDIADKDACLKTPPVPVPDISSSSLKPADWPRPIPNDKSAFTMHDAGLAGEITFRALARAEHRRVLTAGQAQRLRGMLFLGRASWILMVISEEVRARAGMAFPVEPLRTLNTIHLATDLIFLRVFPDLRLLSFDSRILENALPLMIVSGG